MPGSHSWRLLAWSSSPLFSTLWAGLSAVRLEVFNSSCHQFRLPVRLADVSPASLAFGRSVLLHWMEQVQVILGGISALMEQASSVYMMINVHLASLNLLSAVRFFEKLWRFYSCAPRPSEGLTSSDTYMRLAPVYAPSAGSSERIWRQLVEPAVGFADVGGRLMPYVCCRRMEKSSNPRFQASIRMFDSVKGSCDVRFLDVRPQASMRKCTWYESAAGYCIMKRSQLS